MIGSPGTSVVPATGAFDLEIVSTGEPVAVVAVWETAEVPLPAMIPVFLTTVGAPPGSATRKVSSGETSTLALVAAGKATGPLAVALAAKVSDSPAFAPAATVHVHV